MREYECGFVADGDAKHDTTGAVELRLILCTVFSGPN